jgi:CNT family concentrative nucleoside transporter
MEMTIYEDGELTVTSLRPLCGFANIGSLGNQIGVLSQIAPGRASDVSRVAFSAYEIKKPPRLRYRSYLTGGTKVLFLIGNQQAGNRRTNEKQYFGSSS